jgi:hypothetical protein
MDLRARQGAVEITATQPEQVAIAEQEESGF